MLYFCANSFKMKKIAILFAFCLFVSVSTFAQVSVNESAEIKMMMERFVEGNRNVKKISGYRIQIFATRDRLQLEKTQREFQYTYPNISVDWVHDRPNYILRAGAFESKLDAYRLWNIIRKDYNGALISFDNGISPIDLIF
jgi:hypothetical protein